ncbi:DUF655 domain-containing protein [Candidatus Micrarchaeota archaeon]|nr:DUF655 domain-containing protein [Candidatus Micrarchaeota archaeon]
MFRKEENAFVLDFLRSGKSGEARQEPTAQVLGDQYFTLLELITKQGIELKPKEKVYIGKGVRDKIERIKCRIMYDQLTNAAQQEVEEIIRDILTTRETDFVNFLNKAGPINIRIHSLELLPNVGKKNLESLLAEREKALFESFENIRQRVAHLTNIEDILLQRIIHELKGQEKYYLFVKIPPKLEEDGEQRPRRHSPGPRFERYGGSRLGPRF